MKPRAFTLIELLVVIAIIGVLSSVVLSSLNSARSKGNDAAVKSNLRTILTQSYLYYDTNGSYGSSLSATTTATTAGSACGGSSGLFGDTSVMNAMKAATNAGGSTSATGRMMCDIWTSGSFSFWEVLVPLASNSAQAWCVSSNGISKQVTTPSATTGAPDC